MKYVLLIAIALTSLVALSSSRGVPESWKEDDDFNKLGIDVEEVNEDDKAEVTDDTPDPTPTTTTGSSSTNPTTTPTQTQSTSDTTDTTTPEDDSGASGVQSSVGMIFALMTLVYFRL